MDLNAAARSLVLTLTCLAASGSVVPSIGRADDSPPPLTGPEGSVPAPIPIPAPVAPQPAPAPARPARDDRPVLALPGITAPAARNRPVTTPMTPPPSIGPTSDGGLPPLEMPGGKPTTNSSSSSMPDLIPLPSDRFRAREIESVPIDGIPPLTAPIIPRSNSAASTPGRARVMSSEPPFGTPSRNSRPSRDELDSLDPRPLNEDKDLDKDKKAEPPAPRRGFGLFNRWMPRPAAEVESSSGIKVEPRSDPAADAAIKRRVERQANDAIGDRAKNIDVRVVGRSITIQAHGVKFLQRRTVKRSLESLPGLSGYRSIIEVVD